MNTSATSTPVRFMNTVGDIARLWIGLIVLMLFASGTLAQPSLEKAAPTAIETLFDHPRYGMAELSPNTRNLAITAKVGERMRLLVIDLESRKATQAASFGDADVAWFTWLNDRRLVFSVDDQKAVTSEQPGEGLFAVDADGGDLRELIPTIKKQLRSALYVGAFRVGKFLARVRGTDDMLVMRHESGQKGMYVMRQNTRTKREVSAVTGIAGDIVYAKADAAGELRAVMSVDRDGRAMVWYRADAESKWGEVARFDSLYGTDVWRPVGFAADGKTMWVSARAGEDLAAIHEFDPVARRLGEKSLSHPSADIVDTLHFDPGTGNLLGVTVEAAERRETWFDPGWAKAQASIDAALPGLINRLSGDAKSRLLVYSFADRNPGGYHLYDVEQGRLSELFTVRPDIEPAQMSQTRLIRYAARDQLSIPAYLTLPHGAEEKNLPLVVLVHGGPYYVRDHWGFNPEVQFLASRGYAVLQPQFRGTGGFGARLFRAGWKNWGLAMQDDLTDGVKFLIDKGTVDARRVCIMGASYGGYAAFMATIKDPGVFRCGIGIAGVTDLNLLFSATWTDYANSVWSDFGMKELIGDPGKLKSQFASTSPAKQASRVAAPLLIAHGSDDHRVPRAHGEALHEALAAEKKPHEWLVFDGEGHGLMKAENRHTLYRAVERFLQQHMGHP